MATLKQVTTQELPPLPKNWQSIPQLKGLQSVEVASRIWAALARTAAFSSVIASTVPLMPSTAEPRMTRRDGPKEVLRQEMVRVFPSLDDPFHERPLSAERALPLRSSDPLSLLVSQGENDFRLSIEHGSVEEILSEIIVALEDPTVDNAVILRLLGDLNRQNPSTMKNLREALLSSKGKGLEETAFADQLIKTNPRIFLSITNKYGEPLIKTMHSFHHMQHMAHSQLGKLRNFHLEILRLGTSHGYSNDSELRSHIERVQRSFTDRETGIDLESFSHLCKTVWELDKDALDPVFLGRNYGRDKILSDPLLLCDYKGQNLLDNWISSLEIDIHSKTPDLTDPKSEMPVQCITAGESLETAQLKKSFNQVQTFLMMLEDPSCSRKELTRVFLSLDPSILGFLSESVWFAHGEPRGDFQYGEHFICREPRALLKIQDMSGINVVSALRDHFGAQLQSRNMLEQATQLQDLLTSEAPSSEVLACTRSLDKALRSRLTYSIWFEDGGKDNRRFGGVGYGDRELEADPKKLITGSPSILSRTIEQLRSHTEISLSTGMATIRKELHNDALSPAETGVEPLLVDTREVPREVADKHFRVAMVTAELQGVISQGGLAGAVYGMAKSMQDSSDGRNVRVIMPKYDVLPPQLRDRLVERPELAIEDIAGRVHKVFSAMVDNPGSGPKLEGLFIEDDDHFTVGFNKEGKPNSIYNGGTDKVVKERFAHFQAHAAALAQKLYERKEIEVLHVQDSQAALVPEIIAQRYTEKWERGETPSVVFTFHNNLEGSQGRYEDHEGIESLGALGLRRQPMNSFVQGLHVAEVVTTVSPKFAAEAQKSMLGRGVDHVVKQVALRHKLFGVINGNNIGGDPKTDPVLKGWRDPITNEPVDLTYGSEDTLEEIVEKQRLCREQLSKYVNVHGLGELDPDKPIILYVGRLDSHQKGIDKLPFVMEQALEQGAQIVVIGIDADPQAKRILDEMKREAKTKHGNKGVIILEDFRRPDGRLHWQMGYPDSLKMVEDLLLEIESGHVEAQATFDKLPEKMKKEIYRAIWELDKDAPEAAFALGAEAALTAEESYGKRRMAADIGILSNHKGHNIIRDVCGVPGFGSVLRAATDLACFPSSFEPCGLVQGETFMRGKRVMATDSGGFHNTIITEGERKNGYLFPRANEWMSERRQIKPMLQVLMGAIEDMKVLLAEPLVHAAEIKRIMKEAQATTWSSTPDGSLSPAQQYRLVYGASLQRKSHRGATFLDTHLSRPVFA